MRQATRHTAKAGARKHKFGELRPGNHVAFIYEDTADLTAFLVPYIRNGLARNERCVYVSGELERTEFTRALVAAGVDLERETERGALVVSSAEDYYALPAFDALRLVEFWRRKAIEATSRGFAGLRVAAEMAWVLQGRIGEDALLEYESLLDDTLSLGLLTVACLYRRDQFRPPVLQRLIRSHAKVCTRDSVLLSLSALFHDLARSDLQSLLQSAGERRKRKGEFYFHQGDRATEVFVLTHGSAKLVRTDPEGRSVILRIIAPTEPFGDRAALLGTTRLASAQALENSRALVWDSPTILDFMMTHPAVSLNAVRLLEDRVEEERDRIVDLAAQRVERRLARLLLRLALSMGRKTPRGVSIEVPLSGNDLAELAIATPYTISRILAAWRRRRIAERRRQQILILDKQRMAALAGVRLRRTAS